MILQIPKGLQESEFPCLRVAVQWNQKHSCVKFVFYFPISDLPEHCKYEQLNTWHSHCHQFGIRSLSICQEAFFLDQCRYVFSPTYWFPGRSLNLTLSNSFRYPKIVLKHHDIPIIFWHDVFCSQSFPAIP